MSTHKMNFYATWLMIVLGVSITALLAMVNLRGVGNPSSVEIITVYGKLFVLLGLAIFGLVDWSPEQLTSGISPKHRLFPL